MVKVSDESRAQPVERLAAAATEICLEDGLGALSARTLAGRSGFSASAMTYHFGDRAGLVGHVQALAHLQLEAWRAEQRAALHEPPRPAWLSTPAWTISTLEDLLERRRRHLALQLELEAEGAAAAPALLDGAADEFERMYAFWRDGARRTGASADEAEAWADLAIGLANSLLAEPGAAGRLSWIVDAVMRLHARLRRADIGSAVEPTLDANARITEPPSAEGARRILDAALRVVGEKGVDRMTQRDVAAAAGLSLAATTYFFRTKSDLLHAAFDELHRRVRADVLEHMARNRNGALGPSELVDEASDLAWRVRAMEALHRAAVRDPALRRLAREMLSTRGATSLSVLRGLGANDADALDAFIWSISMATALRRVRLLEPASRADALAEIGERKAKLIFATAL
ncbi:TetR/AcrR family transcriptional regulator [Phenylobacterium sp.]|uniref:TetR/AcrR family transcriptional regulator n=1 Tax=Phenylobacterium sp. TaxID=1871053 RepID=UPI0035B405B0